MSEQPNTVWLRTTCAQNGLPLADDQLEELGAFASQLLEWNKNINLISRRDEGNLWSVHILHSLSVLFKLEIPHGAKVLDLGTGGGLPGIPIKIARPDLSFTLLDSTQKKTKVVKDIVRVLELTDVRVEWGRAEDLGKQQGYAHYFDVVFARAVASLKDLVRWSFPLLKQSGTNTLPADRKASFAEKRIVARPSLVAFKGGDLESEVGQVRNDPRVGMVSVVELSLLGSNQLEGSEKKIVVVEAGVGHKEKAK